MLNYVYSPFRLIFFQFGFINKIRLSINRLSLSLEKYHFSSLHTGDIPGCVYRRDCQFSPNKPGKY